MANERNTKESQTKKVALKLGLITGKFEALRRLSVDLMQCDSSDLKEMEKIAHCVESLSVSGGEMLNEIIKETDPTMVGHNFIRA